MGYKISAEGVDTDQKKVEAIYAWSRPSSVGELWSFLGLAGYYYRFVEGCAHKSAIVYDLVNACIGVQQGSF
jgi:hypothetical protein